MKKILIYMSLFVMLFYSLTNVYAEYTSAHKISGDYVYIIKDGYAVFRDYTGNDEHIVIPSEIDGYKVIGIDCIFNIDNIKTVTISEGIEYIEGWAFSSSNIASITIPNTVTFIGENAFASCNSLTEITIPESVTDIGMEAFAECENLVTANILGNVVGRYMFYHCMELTNVNLSENVNTIDDWAFFACTSLTEITIPESVTTIGTGAFRATGLESVIIPENVTKLEYNIFQYCYDLKNVVFKNPDTTFEEVAGIREHVNAYEKDPTFFKCNNLSTFYAFKGSQAEEYSLKNSLEFVPVARVEVNGVNVKTDVPPIIKNGRVLIPMRAMFETLGANINWNGETRTVTANTASSSVVMQINNPQMQVNGAAKTLDVAPEILMNRTLVPARAVSESLGATVEWDEARQTVVVTY